MWNFFQEAAAEPGLLSWQRDDLTRLLRTFTRMHSLLMTMSTIIRRGYGGPLPSIADGMKNILTATVDYYAWLECYTLTPDECPDQPDFDKAIEDFMKAVSDARIRGILRMFPLSDVTTYLLLFGIFAPWGVKLHVPRAGCMNCVMDAAKGAIFFQTL